MSKDYVFTKKYRKDHPKQLRRNLLADTRWWVFVLNNPWSNDVPKQDFKDVDMVTWQLEVGTMRSTPHLQGVVQFLYPKSYSQVKMMCPSAWWHVMLGSKEEAVAYCTKEETRIAGPWSHLPVAQAVLNCLKGLSGSPCTRDYPARNSHAHIEALADDSVVPEASRSDNTIAAPACPSSSLEPTTK